MESASEKIAGRVIEEIEGGKKVMVIYDYLVTPNHLIQSLIDIYKGEGINIGIHDSTTHVKEVKPFRGLRLEDKWVCVKNSPTRVRFFLSTSEKCEEKEIAYFISFFEFKWTDVLQNDVIFVARRTIDRMLNELGDFWWYVLRKYVRSVVFLMPNMLRGSKGLVETVFRSKLGKFNEIIYYPLYDTAKNLSIKGLEVRKLKTSVSIKTVSTSIAGIAVTKDPYNLNEIETTVIESKDTNENLFFTFNFKGGTLIVPSSRIIKYGGLRGDDFRLVLERETRVGDIKLLASIYRLSEVYLAR